MTRERDIVEELWRSNPLRTIRAFADNLVGNVAQKLRRAMVRARRGAPEGPSPLPAGVDEGEILAALRACNEAMHQQHDAYDRLMAQVAALDAEPLDDYPMLVDRFRRQAECDRLQVELLNLALELDLASDQDKRDFAIVRDHLARRMARYLVDSSESAGLEELLARLLDEQPPSRTRWSFRARKERVSTDMSTRVVEAVHRAIVLERATGAGIDVDEADAQERAR